MKIKSVSIWWTNVSGEALVVTLEDNRCLTIPIGFYPRLENATREQRNDYRIIAGGIGVHWPQLDEDLSLEGMLRGTAAPGGTATCGQRRHFTVLSAEEEAAEKFQKKHDKRHGKTQATVGGRYTWSFTLTGIGTVVKVTCSDCGKTKDVSDYEGW